MGRPRTPTALKRLSGTERKSRINGLEPTPELGMPAAPGHLSERARRAFERLGEYMAGRVALVDELALECAAQAYCDWREAVEFLKEHGTIQPNGKPYPYVRQRNDASRRFLNHLRDCGLTPAARNMLVKENS